ncbi:IclR family transcriptional regulator [Pseudonocardia hierapolitana]|uniref:IclR family transcriptional regulator n=2 Tax=Pseudonocardia hierapolitana TaxID=1128676 RepID=A0A561SJT8_9PSEU|nr:IclR family transcriptional regulator [Pseudonocardia hierapolitana]
MAGLAKGLRIIEAFDEAHPKLTVSTAAEAAGITPAAARRCLLTMQELGYVSHDGKFFRPTPRMQRLGGSYSGSAPLPVLAQPHLQVVRDELGESASLAVLDGSHVTFVARVESQRIVTMNVRLGARLPAHASATGRLLLSALPDEEIDRHLEGCVPERTGPNTVTDVAEIRRRILAVRESGVSFTDEELELGIRTVAVPVVDAAGRTHAALSLAVLASRTSMDELRERHVPVMQREAARLGQML